MEKKKIVSIVGARPQFVKAAVVSRALKNTGQIEELLVHTGQHFDDNMSQVFFDEMDIPKPRYNLEISGLSHGQMTGRMMEAIEGVLLKEKPDWVLVYGDTNSTLAGALAATKLHIKVAHVEAGLRSYNMLMPEEVNRILTDQVSSILFCPTQIAINNLKREGLEKRAKFVTCGDVMYDAALYYESKSRKPEVAIKDDFVLCTIHRAENTDTPENLLRIFRALEKMAQSKDILLPLHPRTRLKLNELGYGIENSGITFCDPLGYFEIIYLLKHCSLVITDSGGLQKEAYFFDKYCITAREETEWMELVDEGYNRLVGSDENKLFEAFEDLADRGEITDKKALYGEGKAGEIIANELLAI